MRLVLTALLALSTTAACQSAPPPSSGRFASPSPDAHEPGCVPGGGDTTNATYLEFQVGGAPRQLVAGPVAAGSHGTFVVQFIVDTAGVPVASTVQVVGRQSKSPASPELAASVSRLRYEPASYHGCRIWLVLQEPWR